MLNKMLGCCSLFLVMLFGLGSVQASDLTADELVGLKQKDGYVVYVRHAATDHTQTDLFSHRSNLKGATGIWHKPEGVKLVFKPNQTEERGYKYSSMIIPYYGLGLGENMNMTSLLPSRTLC